MNNPLNTSASRKEELTCSDRTAHICGQIPNGLPSNTSSQSNENGKSHSLLRRLRENKQMSQTELANRALISRRKLQKMEKKKLGELQIGEIIDFAKGIGYEFMDLLQLLHEGNRDNSGILKFSFDKPLSTIRFREGVELLTFVENGAKDFIGLLNLEASKSLDWKNLPMADVLFGFVLKGRLLVDSLGVEKVVEEKSCFCIPGFTPFELHNIDFVPRISILLFSRICSGL